MKITVRPNKRTPDRAIVRYDRIRYRNAAVNILFVGPIVVVIDRNH